MRRIVACAWSRIWLSEGISMPCITIDAARDIRAKAAVDALDFSSRWRDPDGATMDDAV